MLPSRNVASVFSCAFSPISHSYESLRKRGTSSFTSVTITVISIVADDGLAYLYRPVDRQHVDVVEVLPLVVEGPRQPHHALPVDGRDRKHVVLLAGALNVVDHLPVGALVAVDRLQRGEDAGRAVLGHLQHGRERPEDRLVVVDVLHQQQEALRHEVALAQPTVGERQDERVLVPGLSVQLVVEEDVRLGGRVLRQPDDVAVGALLHAERQRIAVGVVTAQSVYERPDRCLRELLQPYHDFRVVVDEEHGRPVRAGQPNAPAEHQQDPDSPFQLDSGSCEIDWKVMRCGVPESLGVRPSLGRPGAPPLGSSDASLACDAGTFMYSAPLNTGTFEGYMM
uniref:Uncharacterized protein n=1 Tax=Anopheles atroparvus TaxID=41427 RepID=A0A182IZ44_ANOAO